MPLGLAKDSMLNLADLAKKVEDGEYKTSFEYDEEDGNGEKVIHLSTGNKCVDAEEDGSASAANGGRVESQTSDFDTSPLSPAHGEMKTSEDPHAVFADDKASIASSIDSDMATKSAPALPQTATTPTSEIQQTSYGKYSGFNNSDYDYYEDYTAYAGKGDSLNLLGNGNKEKKQGFWCCLFPWVGQDRMIAVDESSEVPGKESLVNVATEAQQTARGASRDDDETSTGSDMFGEKLSDKDRQAVLARLRLAQPDATLNGNADAGSELKPKEKGLLNGVHIPPDGDGAEEQKPVTKGILKRPSKTVIDSLSKESINGDASRRRSLFPAYAEKSKKNLDLNLTFSPMARVLSVKSHKDMEEGEKGEVWWQKRDYEGFRKTGRMITRAMLEGGSEIWLATNRSWQLPNQARSTTLKHATSLAERQAAKEKGVVKKDYEAARDKWWHKFGHSRRGLEHVASIDEGRQRQSNVRQAIRAVVEENRRQKAFMREDADKLRMVSIQHTSWARDLAMAAGASDADAVRVDFDDQSRKSREFYLLKFSRANQAKAAKSSNNPLKSQANVPAFMRPAMNLTVKPNRLDANTISQIRYRQTKSSKPKRMASAPTPSAPVTSSLIPQPNQNEKEIMLEKQSMAKKAAGFAQGEALANMSAVLTGMGPLPKSATTVGGA